MHAVCGCVVAVAIVTRRSVATGASTRMEWRASSCWQVQQQQVQVQRSLRQEVEEHGGQADIECDHKH